MLYLYAIIDRPHEPLGLPAGIGGEPLGCVAVGQAGAIVAAHAGGTPRPEPALLWRHEEVVEGLMQQRSVLPVRFGTLLGGEAELLALLRERHDRFVAGLAHVAGRVELALRVLWAEEQAAPVAPAGRPASGRDYLLRRMAEERAGEELRRRAGARAEELHRALAGLAADSRSRVAPGPQALLSAAYLLPRSGVEPFRAAVAGLGAANPGLRLLCTGPWPAYNFVEG